MDAPDEFSRRVLESLAVLPDCEEAETLRDLLNAELKRMSFYRVLDLGRRVRLEFDCEHPGVRSALEMIDGQIALRAIAGGDGWR